jgi:steroid delta-isomerase-like uncharacterized protein
VIAPDSAKHNEDVVRKCVEEIWNKGNLEVMAELVDSTFLRHHERDQDEDVHGIEGFRRWVTASRQALPDMQLTIERLFAENDQVMVHLGGKGTHKGELKGVPATGTELEWTVTAFVRLVDGKISECWAIADTLGILQRLKKIPAIG